MSPTNDLLDRELIKLSPTDSWTVRDAVEGTLVIGAPGSGKTANVGKNIALALLNTPGSGGVVLTGKGSDTNTWRRYAAECGRTSDMIIFNRESQHAFDPLFYLWNSGRGAGDLETLIEFFDVLLSLGKQTIGANTDRFWTLAAQQLMRHVIVLLALSGKRISLTSINEVIQSLATSPEEADDPHWEENAFSAKLLGSIRDRKDTLTESQWADLNVASRFLFEKWPAYDVKPRSSIEMTFSSMADRFLFAPLREVFSDGRCTFLPEQCIYEHKWIICDWPVLEYGLETGAFINLILKTVFQRAWLRRDLSKASNLLCLFQDEFQLFVAEKSLDNLFQQTARSSLVAVVCLTQNILGLSERLSENEPGSKTRGFLGNLANKFFLQQNELLSATYAADQLGKEYRFLPNFNAGSGQQGHEHTSVGGSHQLVYQMEPSAFSRLVKPNSQNPWAETVCYVGGRYFEATKSANCPEGRNYIRVAFSRDIKGAK